MLPTCVSFWCLSLIVFKTLNRLRPRLRLRLVRLMALLLHSNHLRVIITSTINPDYPNAFVTLYLGVDVENGLYKLTKPHRYWYSKVDADTFPAKRNMKRGKFFGRVKQQSDLGDTAKRFWVSGSSIFTKYWGKRLSYLNFSCNAKGDRFMTIPRVRYRRLPTTVFLVEYEKYEAGFATMKRTSVEQRTDVALTRVDAVEKHYQRFF